MNMQKRCESSDCKFWSMYGCGKDVSFSILAGGKCSGFSHRVEFEEVAKQFMSYDSQELAELRWAVAVKNVVGAEVGPVGLQKHRFQSTIALFRKLRRSIMQCNANCEPEEIAEGVSASLKSGYSFMTLMKLDDEECLKQVVEAAERAAPGMEPDTNCKEPKAVASIQHIRSFTDVLPSISKLDTQSIDELKWAIWADSLTKSGIATDDAIKITQKVRNAILHHDTSMTKDEALGAIKDMLGSEWTPGRILAIADQSFLGIVLAYAMESIHTITDYVASKEAELLSARFRSEGFKETAAKLIESVPSALDESSPYFSPFGNEAGFVNVALMRRKDEAGNEYYDIHVVDDINGEDCYLVSTQSCDQQQVAEALMEVFITTVTKAYSKASEETR